MLSTRQRLLDQVTGEELQPRLLPPEVVDAVIESERERHPDGAPGRGLLDGDLVGTPVEDAEVQRQHRQHEGIEADPEPELIHLSPHLLATSRR